MVRNSKQIWLCLTKQFLLIRNCMIYECTLIKHQQRLIILSSITKPSLIRLYKIDYKIDFKQLMVTNTANRPSHEREKQSNIIITNESEP